MPRILLIVTPVCPPHKPVVITVIDAIAVIPFLILGYIAVHIFLEHLGIHYMLGIRLFITPGCLSPRNAALLAASVVHS